ncbi:hypothetical protein HanIR_Chr17g0888721 [Helianthus annuus]|nr:hypothetical protein HanIR_Chr17g0888721 [Helianthus annuus]
MLIIRAIVPREISVPAIQVVEIRGGYDCPITRGHQPFRVVRATIPCLHDRGLRWENRRIDFDFGVEYNVLPVHGRAVE